MFRTKRQPLKRHGEGRGFFDRFQTLLMASAILYSRVVRRRVISRMQESELEPISSSQRPVSKEVEA